MFEPSHSISLKILNVALPCLSVRLSDFRRSLGKPAGPEYLSAPFVIDLTCPAPVSPVFFGDGDVRGRSHLRRKTEKLPFYVANIAVLADRSLFSFANV